MKFQCVCGYESDSSQQFNGHRSHCRVYLGEQKWEKTKTQDADRFRMYNLQRSEELQALYERSPKECLHCGKTLLYKDRYKSFCNSSCAASYNNTHKLKKSAFTNTTRKRSPDGQYQCPCCHLTFTSQRSVNSHLSGVHKDYIQTQPLILDKEGLALDISNGVYEEYIQSHQTCEICGRTVDDTKTTGHFKRFNIDHEHGTNHFRGLLCTNCNTKLGWFEKYVDVIGNYLKRNTATEINIEVKFKDENI